MTNTPRHFDPDVSALEADNMPPSIDLHDALSNIESDIARIRRGLSDEHEGEVTKGVAQLAAQARLIEQLVSTW